MLTTSQDLISARARNSESFIDFLLNKDLYSTYKLSANGTLNFHWADAGETCKFLIHNIKNRGSKYPEFKMLLEHINDLKMALVWVKSDSRIIQSNLFELYHLMINPLKTSKLNFLQFKSCDLSLIGPTGPFKNVDLKSWLNREDYLSVVYKSILTSELPPREFRLRTSGKILCDYGDNNSNSCVLHVKQIGVSGILFSTAELNLYGLIKNCETLNLKLDTDLFKFYANDSFENIYNGFGDQKTALLFSYQEKDRANVLVSGVKSYLAVEHGQKSHYLFVPYSAFSGVGESKASDLKCFTKNIRQKILENL